MKKQESIYQLAIGLIGVAFSLFLQKWAYLPMILIGVLAVVMIRREKPAQLTEAERKRFRLVNIISLICWVVFALLGFLLLRDKPVGAEGLWFALSAYLFIAVHGALLLVLPVKE
jgi:predicted branched-subunit amino acid permease